MITFGKVFGKNDFRDFDTGTTFVTQIKGRKSGLCKYFIHKKISEKLKKKE